MKILNTVKVDKLCFSLDINDSELVNNIEVVIAKYYDDYHFTYTFKQLYIEVTPTRQKRKYYNGLNHNFQMIPLDKFSKFLKELRSIAEQNIKVYEIHLAKDILVSDNTNNYISCLLLHEYMNGYHSYTEEADSSSTAYISRKKDLDSNGELKLLTKFYDKMAQLISKEKIERLPLKEPVEDEDLPIEVIDGRTYINLKNMNCLRCEIELREDNLLYHTIDQFIEAIEKGIFQSMLEAHYNAILNRTVFAKPKLNANCSKLKEIAINLVGSSKRDYNMLFSNMGMGREYRYFRHAKETVTRKNDSTFEELEIKLVKE